jgi:hypothetical protein
MVKYLLSRNVTVNSKTKSGDTALHLAALAGNGPIFGVLIQAGADIDSLTFNGSTSLMSGIQGNACNHLLANIIYLTRNLEAKDNKGRDALHLACMKNNLEISEQLIERGCNVNSLCKVNMSPLMWACYQGNADLIEFLLRHRANPALECDEGRSCFDYLMLNRAVSNAEKARLMQLPALIKTESWARRGDLDLFRYQAGFVPVPEALEEGKKSKKSKKKVSKGKKNAKGAKGATSGAGAGRDAGGGAKCKLTEEEERIEIFTDLFGNDKLVRSIMRFM